MVKLNVLTHFSVLKTVLQVEYNNKTMHANKWGEISKCKNILLYLFKPK